MKNVYQMMYVEFIAAANKQLKGYSIWLTKNNFTTTTRKINSKFKRKFY
jgi:hypothetical protein